MSAREDVVFDIANFFASKHLPATYAVELALEVLSDAGLIDMSIDGDDDVEVKEWIQDDVHATYERLAIPLEGCDIRHT
jgi:hypothetical protein